MKTIRTIVIAAIILFLSFSAIAQEMTKRTAKISDMKGTVEVRTAAGQTVPASIGMILNEGDVVTTKGGSTALLFLEGASETATVEVKSNAKLKLSEMLENKEKGVQMTLLDLSLGEILIKAKKLHSEGSKFEVKTPTSIVGVKGTTFSVAVEAVED